jgi:hypothetical protein
LITIDRPPAIEVRDAAPADAGAFADLAALASGSLAPVLHSSLQSKNLSTYNKVLIAAVDGHPAGMLPGFTWREQDAENEATHWLHARYLRVIALGTMPCN